MKCSKDFIVSYNKLFKFLKEKDALDEFWPILSDAILGRLRFLVKTKGLLGMVEYWTDTLSAEEADCTMFVNLEQKSFTLSMNECPSLKTLGTDVMPGYCDHCNEIYGHLLKEFGYSFNKVGSGGKCVIKIKEIEK